jgi:hypothetical protein
VQVSLGHYIVARAVLGGSILPGRLVILRPW